MNTDRLKLFKSEDEIKSFAKVNGYGEKGTQELISQWNAIKSAPVTKEPKKGSKKFGVFSADDYSSKD